MAEDDRDRQHERRALALCAVKPHGRELHYRRPQHRLRRAVERPQHKHQGIIIRHRQQHIADRRQDQSRADAAADARAIRTRAVDDLADGIYQRKHGLEHSGLRRRQSHAVPKSRQRRRQVQPAGVGRGIAQEAQQQSFSLSGCKLFLHRRLPILF